MNLGSLNQASFPGGGTATQGGGQAQQQIAFQNGSQPILIQGSQTSNVNGGESISINGPGSQSQTYSPPIMMVNHYQSHLPLQEIQQQLASANNVSSGMGGDNSLIIGGGMSSENEAYFSPNHSIQQRIRTESLGNYHFGIQPLNGNNSVSSQVIGSQQHLQNQLIFSDQSQTTPPYYQHLGAHVLQPNHYLQHLEQASVESSTHINSTTLHQNNTLQNMEPFSLQHFSQISAASVMYSNLPSHKGSFHTDESLSASPQQQASMQQQFGGVSAFGMPTSGIPQHVDSHSVFSRHGTSFKRSAYNVGGKQTTASLACNEGGPLFGNMDKSSSKMYRQYYHQSILNSQNDRFLNANPVGTNPIGFSHVPSTLGEGGNQGEDKEAVFEDFEMADATLDGIKMPSVNFNIQVLVLLIKENIIAQSKESQSPESGRKQRDSADSPILQRDEVTVSKPKQQNEAVEILQQQSVFQQIEISHPITQGASQIIPQQQEYQKLSIEQTIWSTQVPGQTHKEFFNSQVFQQQNPSQEQVTLPQPQIPSFSPPIGISTQQTAPPQPNQIGIYSQQYDMIASAQVDINQQHANQQQNTLHLLMNQREPPQGHNQQQLQEIAFINQQQQIIAQNGAAAQLMQQSNQTDLQNAHILSQSSTTQQQHHTFEALSQLQQPTPLYANSQGIFPPQDLQALEMQLNDPMNLNHFDNTTHLSTLYMSRQMNRYMMNPVYMSDKTHKFAAGQSQSFRGATQSPEIDFPGNLSVLRPPPGFEHVIPKIPPHLLNENIMQQVPQLPQQPNNAGSYSIDQQQQQIQSMYQQQELQNQQLLANQAAAAQLQYHQQQLIQQQFAVPYQASVQQQQQFNMIQNQHQASQHHMLPAPAFQNHFNHYHHNHHHGGNAQHHYINPWFANFPSRTEDYSSFFDKTLRSKQSEIEEQLRKTAQYIDSKLSEFQDEGEDGEQQEENQQMPSYPQTESENVIHSLPIPQPQQLLSEPMTALNSQQLQSLLMQQQYDQQLFQTAESHAASLIGGPPPSIVVLGSSSSSTCSKDDEKTMLMEATRRQLLNLQQQSQSSRNNVVGTEEKDIQLHKELNSSGRNGAGSSSEFGSVTCKKLKTLSSFNKEEFKEKRELFTQLRNQLNKLKNDQQPLAQDQYSAISTLTKQQQEMSPFQVDPSKYLDKISNILTIINKVEQSTNMKSEYEKVRVQLEKKRAEFMTIEQQLRNQRHEVEQENQRLHQELKSTRDQINLEREQYELRTQRNVEQMYSLQEMRDALQAKVSELHQQLDAEVQMKMQTYQLNSFEQSKATAQGLEQERIMQLMQQEYSKKIGDQQAELEQLREYIKKRGQDDAIKKLEEKRLIEIEMQKYKDSYEQLKKASEFTIKERENELRLINETLQRYDNDLYKQIISGTQYEKNPRVCSDCKKKEKIISDKEARIEELNEYIKKKTERGTGEQKIRELEEEIIKMKCLHDEKIKTLENTLKSNLQRQDVSPQQPSIPFGLCESIYSLFCKLGEDYFSRESKTILLDYLTTVGQGHNPVSHHGDIRDCVDDIVQKLRPLARCPAPTLSQEEKLRQLQSKVTQSFELGSHYRDVFNEGRNERKICHQIICEAEKLMYKMSSHLIQEQMNLEEEMKTVEPASINQTAQKSLQTIERLLTYRSTLYHKINDLFQKILETYLQIPHKLKPIYDRMKKYEHTISKIFKADPDLLKDLTPDLIKQYQIKLEEISMKYRETELVNQQQRGQIMKHADECESQKAKIMSLNEKIVQVNSAYNALQKHLYSQAKAPGALTSSILSQSNTPNNHHSSQHSMTLDLRRLSIQAGSATGDTSSNNSNHSTDRSGLGGAGCINEHASPNILSNIGGHNSRAAMNNNLNLGASILGSSTSSDGGSSFGGTNR